MIYGKNGVFDAERLIDVLSAFEDFKLASVSARGDLDDSSSMPLGSLPNAPRSSTSTVPEPSTSGQAGNSWPAPVSAGSPTSWPFPFPAPAGFVDGSGNSLDAAMTGVCGSSLGHNR